MKEVIRAIKSIVATLAGLEPTRDKPNRFLVDRLNRSATVSLYDLMIIEEKLYYSLIIKLHFTSPTTDTYVERTVRTC